MYNILKYEGSTMSMSQENIFNTENTHFYYLEYNITNYENIQELIKKAMQIKNENSSVLVAFGVDAMNKLAPNLTPKNFTNYETISAKHTMPSTQNDLFFWVQSNNISDAFGQALQISKCMKPSTTLLLDERGFTYHDSRDLVGFIDGTGNPKEQKMYDAALIPNGEVAEGGSFVLAQKWVHNLEAWDELSTKMQSDVIGRDKETNDEQEDDVKAIDSHVARTDIKHNNVPMKIYRRSAPYGSTTEHGLYFLAFACNLERFDTQLKSMCGATDDGISDMLMNFSKPVSGSYWFAPSKEDLTNILS